MPHRQLLDCWIYKAAYMTRFGLLEANMLLPLWCVHTTLLYSGAAVQTRSKTRLQLILRANGFQHVRHLQAFDADRLVFTNQHRC